MREPLHNLEGPVKSRPPIPIRRRILVWIEFLLATWIGMGALLAWAIIRPKRGKLVATPAVYGMRFEPIEFRSADGTRISGWYIPAARLGRPSTRTSTSTSTRTVARGIIV